MVLISDLHKIGTFIQILILYFKPIIFRNIISFYMYEIELEHSILSKISLNQLDLFSQMECGGVPIIKILVVRAMTVSGKFFFTLDCTW